MRSHVTAHAVAERGIAHKGRDHRHHMAALAIGDRIERGIDLGGLDDGLMDRASGQQRVSAHRCKAFGQRARADVQIGAPLVADAVAHPVGKTLVQPDVVPPGRGDQITKPLVRQLMADHHAKEALLLGRGLVVEDQQRIRIQIGAGILHRAGHDRRGDLIELGIRERLAEIAFQMGDDALGAFQRKAQARRILLSRDHPDRQRDAALRRRRHGAFGGHKGANHQRDQIAGQRQRWRKAMHGDAVASLAAGFGRVADGLQARRSAQGDLPRRLEARLVKAGEGGACVGGLKLRPAVPVVADLDAEQTCRALVEARVIVKRKSDRTCRQGFAECQQHNAGRIGLPERAGHHGAACLSGDAGDLQIAAVHPDKATGFADRRIDLDMPRKPLLGRVYRQVEPISRRHHGAIEFALRHDAGFGRHHRSGLLGKRWQRAADSGKQGRGKQGRTHRSVSI